MVGLVGLGGQLRVGFLVGPLVIEIVFILSIETKISLSWGIPFLLKSVLTSMGL